MTLLVAALALSSAACHETDHLGPRLPLRVVVQGHVPAQASAGDRLRLTVSVVDGTGALARRGRVAHLRLEGSGGSSGGEGHLSPSVVQVSGGGTTTVEVVLQRAGRARIRVSAELAAPWLSDRVEITPGRAAGLRFARQPRDAWPDDPQTLTLEVVDAFGNAVTDEHHVVALDVGGQAQTIGGVARFLLTLAPGVTSVTASAHGLSSVTSRSLSVGRAVGGTLEYGRYPLKFDPLALASALDYDTPLRQPIGGARVQLLSDGEVVGETEADEAGGFRIAAPDRHADLTLRVLAQSTNPAVRVADNTAAGVTFALEHAVTASDDLALVSIYAPGGWTGSGYGERAGAPFALLDTVRKAAQLLTPGWVRTLPPLTVYWSEGNRPVAGDPARGEIGTSHYAFDDDALYVLGAEDEDTDEYDVAVVVHEWGHYLFARGVGRSDTIGGAHGSGFVLDARTAYEEGICNILAGVAGLGGGATYADTSGLRQGSGWFEELDDNRSYDLSPGWHSEASLQALVFDLYDSEGDAAEPWDDLSYGAASLLELLQDVVHGGSYATVFTLLAAARARYPEDAPALDVLAAYHGISSDDDGGWLENLPLFRPVAPGGGAVAMRLEAAYEGSLADWGNRASANRWVTFVGDGRTWQVTSDSSRDIDLYLSQDGWPLTETRAASGNETLFVTTRPGASYIANLRAWEKGAFDFRATLTARPQTSPKKLRPGWVGPSSIVAPSSAARGPRLKRIRGGVRIMRAVVSRGRGPSPGSTP